MSFKRYIQGFVFLAAFGVFWGYFNDVFKQPHHFINTNNGFNNLISEGDPDILLFGSSHVYTVYNPLIINQKIGAVSYNLGSASLKLSVSNLLLKEVLSKTQPKLVILEYCDSDIKRLKDNSEKIAGLQLRVLDELPTFSWPRGNYLFNHYKAEAFLGAISPMYRNHGLWHELDYLDLNRRRYIEEDRFYFAEGFLGVKANVTEEKYLKKYADFPNKQPEVKSTETILKTDNKQLIIDFVEEARSHDVQVLIVSSPELRAPYRDYKIYQELEAFTDSLGVDYLNLNDFNKQMGLTIDDYYDEQHVNIGGSIKVSNFLGEYLNTNFNFDDRRSDLVWQQRDTMFNYFNWDYMDKRDRLFKTKLNETFLENVALDSVQLKQLGSKVDFFMKFNTEITDPQELQKYNMLVRIYPVAGQEDLVAERFIERGWKFDKTDVKLETTTDTISFSLPTKIRGIEKIEMLLYNKEKYQGTVGKRIFIHDIKFEY
ncbi:hypothetical protein [Gilvibacter sp.]|uniref:hypothetical protein n=1 Tax=Gilvibacter sp. TaxID=2729997 RepID=UPI003F4A1F4D